MSRSRWRGSWWGYERAHAGTLQVLGAERAAIGIFLALFHDIGYLRERNETAMNGAEFTRNHVSRSARFMEFYLPTIGFAHWTRVTSEIVHFTGYEKTFEQIGAMVQDPRDIQLGHLLGTADMIAQMADRCYLEKCRDRLYPEFVLGGVALPLGASGDRGVKYALPASTCCGRRRSSWKRRGRKRLDAAFNKALPLSRPAVRRHQSLHRSHRPQPGFPAAGAAQRELAHAAAQSAGVRRRAGFAHQRARPDVQLLQAGLVAQLSMPAGGASTFIT